MRPHLCQSRQLVLCRCILHLRPNREDLNVLNSAPLRALATAMFRADSLTVSADPHFTVAGQKYCDGTVKTHLRDNQDCKQQKQCAIA